MRVALVNPAWSFDGSIYFGCRHPHLPLEYGSARVLLEQAGHQVEIIDGHLFGMSTAEVAGEVRAFRPDMTVVTTAPSYLFWRCAPPELRVPQETFEALDGVGGLKVAVGPHASSTPRAAMRKLHADIGRNGRMRGGRWSRLPAAALTYPGTVVRRGGDLKVLGGPARHPVHRPAADHLGRGMDPPPRSPSPPLRCAPERARRRGGASRGCPIPLQLLRQGELPRQIPARDEAWCWRESTPARARA
jgi:hypothetical protein